LLLLVVTTICGMSEFRPPPATSMAGVLPPPDGLRVRPWRPHGNRIGSGCLRQSLSRLYVVSMYIKYCKLFLPTLLPERSLHHQAQFYSFALPPCSAHAHSPTLDLSSSPTGTWSSAAAALPSILLTLPLPPTLNGLKAHGSVQLLCSPPSVLSGE
jgi:hypothetical protein